MPTLQLYDTLLRFPLFQGMGANELSQLVAGTRLDFVKLEAGSTLLRSGDRNSRLLMLTNGSLQAMTHAADKGYTVAEEIRPPFIVEPERLFGLHQMSATRLPCPHRHQSHSHRQGRGGPPVRTLHGIQA